MRHLWMFALLPVLGSSCAKIGSLEDLGLDAFMPTVQFKRLKVTDLDFKRIDTDFVFSIENPNPIKVKLSSFSYDLDLAGNDLINGNQQDGLALEARGESKLVFPVGVVFADLFQLVGDLKGKDSVPFAFKGKIGFNTPLGEIKIPFQDTGDFPVIHLPRVGFKAVRVGKLDLLRQTATLNVDLGLAHDGGAALAFDGFDYHIDLGGRKVAEGVLEHLASVAGGSEQVVSLPVQLNLLDLGATIVEAITKKTKLDVGLGATVSIGTPFGPVPFTIDERGNVDVK
jgi:LEA14-like dessication related protein